MKALILALFFPLLQGTAPVLSDVEEARAQDLMREIRCAACENEPISQSAAEIAGNMRERVRIMVSEGASDEEVRDWFAERYGEFVLFRPEAEGPGGWLLWGGPFMLLLVGGALVWQFARRGPDTEAIDPVRAEDLQG
ncbi:MAG: cytochrome c-type biogenesis protein [Pseudomonadota bacterium]